MAVRAVTIFIHVTNTHEWNNCRAEEIQRLSALTRQSSPVTSTNGFLFKEVNICITYNCIALEFVSSFGLPVLRKIVA